MNYVNLQRGAASVVIVFVLIVIISSMLGVSFIMSNSSLNSANMHNSANQANYLAESALERVVYNLNEDPSCTALALTVPDQQTLNNGTFEIDSASISTPATDDEECDIKVKGVMNGIVRYISAKIFNNGGAGGGGAGASYFEPFPDAGSFNLNWTEVNTSDDEGQTLFNTSSCTGVCPGTPGTGSMVGYAYTSGNAFDQYIGYREATITTINTGGTGLTLNTLGGFAKLLLVNQFLYMPANIRQTVSIELIETGGAAVELWIDPTVSSEGAPAIWTGISTTTSLPANTSYNRIRIRYDLRGYSLGGNYYGVPVFWLDEINLSAAGGGGAAPDWQVVEWQEVAQ